MGKIHRAAPAVTRRAKELLSVAGTAVRAKATRKHRKGSRITAPSDPSPVSRRETNRPRRRLCHLRSGREGNDWCVGTNVKYMKALELGTKKGIAPRPWLRRALAEWRGEDRSDSRRRRKRPVSYDGINLVAAVLAWWNATPAAQGWPRTASSDRIVPENIQLPYATVALASEVAEIWTTAYPWDRSSLVISLHAATDTQARTNAITLRESSKKCALTINGVAVAHVLPDGSTIDLGQGLGPKGQDLWTATETFDAPWTTQ